MQTQQLAAALKQLDGRVLELGQAVQSLRNRAAACENQAWQLERTADSLMSAAAREEDVQQAADMYARASSCMEQADRYRRQVQELHSQAEGKISELRECRSQYMEYMALGENNLADLQLAAQTLSSMPDNTYGAAKLRQTLTVTKERIIYNRNLIEGCRKRIQWIDQVCGSGTDRTYVKTR